MKIKKYKPTITDSAEKLQTEATMNCLSDICRTFECALKNIRNICDDPMERARIALKDAKELVKIHEGSVYNKSV